MYGAPEKKFMLLRRPHAQGVWGTDQIACTVKGPESPTAGLILSINQWITHVLSRTPCYMSVYHVHKTNGIVLTWCTSTTTQYHHTGGSVCMYIFDARYHSSDYRYHISTIWCIRPFTMDVVYHTHCHYNVSLLDMYTLSTHRHYRLLQMAEIDIVSRVLPRSGWRKSLWNMTLEGI